MREHVVHAESQASHGGEPGTPSERCLILWSGQEAIHRSGVCSYLIEEESVREDVVATPTGHRDSLGGTPGGHLWNT